MLTPVCLSFTFLPYRGAPPDGWILAQQGEGGCGREHAPPTFTLSRVPLFRDPGMGKGKVCGLPATFLSKLRKPHLIAGSLQGNASKENVDADARAPPSNFFPHQGSPPSFLDPCISKEKACRHWHV